MTAILVSPTYWGCGFVGLITPHLARSLVGTNYRRLSDRYFAQRTFIVWADVLARV